MLFACFVCIWTTSGLCVYIIHVQIWQNVCVRHYHVLSWEYLYRCTSQGIQCTFCILRTPWELGPMKVSFKQRCPFYRGWFVHKTINWGKQRCPLYRGVLYRECPLIEVPLLLYLCTCISEESLVHVVYRWLLYTYMYMYMVTVIVGGVYVVIL